MKKSLYAIVILSIFLMAMKADKKAYNIFNQEGKESSYAKLFKQALESDVILFGEQHYNPICHWLQLELAKDLYAERGEDLILGAEMFERDDQLILHEYINDYITTRNFESQARLWPNYKTDYKPLMDFANENNIPFVASNIPRRYASVVFREGFEGLEKLDKHAKRFIAPLPIPYDPELPGYKAMIEMGEEMEGHDAENFPKAQAIKDATMAHAIISYFQEGKIFMHIHGTYHSDNFEGIMWYLNEYNPGLKIMTIASAEQELANELEEDNEGLANFILITPSSMTQTYKPKQGF